MQKIAPLKQYSLLILLIIISTVIYWNKFANPAIINAGDWVYIPDNTIFELKKIKLWVPHSNLGNYTLIATNLVFYWLASYLAPIFPNILNWDIFTRIFFLLPITFLTPIFSFLLFFKISKNTLLAFLASSLYSFNSFFLKLHLDFITNFFWYFEYS